MRAATQRSAELAIQGNRSEPLPDGMRVVNAREDGLHATALFSDGLALPLQRDRVDAPWIIVTQGPLLTLLPLLNVLTQPLITAH